MKDRKMDDLISTEWLDKALDDVRVVDATLFLPDAKRDARAEYAAEHITGAVFLDLSAFADFPEEARFGEAMGALGLSRDDRIVVYDNSPLHSAARAWWLLRSFGASQVAVLDGGLAKWKAEGLRVDGARVAPGQGSFAARADVSGLARMAGVAEPGEAQIVDARSAGRFTGAEAEPRAGIAAGHIPGSRNLPQGKLFAGDGTWKQGEELRAAFREAGVDLERPVITTCGSGVTAAVLSFGAHLLGARDVRLYEGSWAGWGADVETPKAVGAA